MNLDWQKMLFVPDYKKLYNTNTQKIMVTVSLSYKVLFRLQIGSDKLKLYT